MKNKILVILLLTSIIGCRSVKKTSSSSTLKSTVTKSVDSLSISELKTKEKSTEQIKLNEQSFDESLQIDLKNGDSLEIINYDGQGKVLNSKKYKGSGTVHHNKTNKNTEKTTITEKEGKTDSKSKVGLSKYSGTTTSASTASSFKEKKGFSFWSYLFFIIIILIILYLNYRFKIYGFIKKRVLNVFSRKDNLA